MSLSQLDLHTEAEPAADTPTLLRTIELAGWGFDELEARPASPICDTQAKAHELFSEMQPDPSLNAFCEAETKVLRATFDQQRNRPDLLAEMTGLDWSFGVVDLRRLLAFQRRLSFHPTIPEIAPPQQSDWDGLISMAFGPPHPVLCDVIHDRERNTVTLQSSNPNMQVRVTQDPALPIAVYSGSPFFEVAEYAGRWFLRDGYHRAYTLLRAGIFQLPAVIVRARTLEELGATQPWFFAEEILFSDRPPMVSDFLDEALTIEYTRPPIIKTLRITFEESVESATSFSIPGEQP